MREQPRNDEVEDRNADEAAGEDRPETFGPSWGLMLLIILLAMLVALGIAWAFITPLLHRHF